MGLSQTGAGGLIDMRFVVNILNNELWQVNEFIWYCVAENMAPVPYQKVPYLSIRANFAGKPFVRHVPIDLSSLIQAWN